MTVVVIGGGQSGLSAGYHLKRRGFVSALSDPGADRGKRPAALRDGPRFR